MIIDDAMAREQIQKLYNKIMRLSDRIKEKRAEIKSLEADRDKLVVLHNEVRLGRRKIVQFERVLDDLKLENGD